MVPAILAELDYEVHMLNAQTEFLNADVEEDVLVKMAPTYETKDEDIVHLVVNLKKNWYGLRQSSRSSPSSASAHSSRIRACTSTRTRLASSS